MKSNYTINDPVLLKKILWLDATAGGITAVLGLLLSRIFSQLFGLEHQVLIIIASITLIYALVALYLVSQAIIPITLLRILVYANWIWTVISVFLLYFHFGRATMFGLIFLALQIIVVGLLAYFEGKQIAKAQF
jgi:hypothetical protein